MLTFHCDKNTFNLIEELEFCSELSESAQPAIILYSHDNAEMITDEVKQRCVVCENKRLLPHTIIIIQRSDLKLGSDSVSL